MPSTGLQSQPKLHEERILNWFPNVRDLPTFTDSNECFQVCSTAIDEVLPTTSTTEHEIRPAVLEVRLSRETLPPTERIPPSPSSLRWTVSIVCAEGSHLLTLECDCLWIGGQEQNLSQVPTALNSVTVQNQEAFSLSPLPRPSFLTVLRL